MKKTEMNISVLERMAREIASLKVSEVAKLLGVSQYFLRQFPATETIGGHRRWSVEDVAILKAIVDKERIAREKLLKGNK